MFKSSILPWALWICFPLIIALAAFVDWFQLPIIEPNPSQIPAYKFTFIAVLMALAAFQYNIFSSDAERFSRVLDQEDFNPSWKKFIEETADLRARINASPAALEQWVSVLKEREKQIKEHIEWHRVMLPKVVASACIRFVLIFSVGLGVLISLCLDILNLVQVPIWRIDPVAGSQCFLIAAIILFAVLFVCYIHALSQELSFRLESTRLPNQSS
jgi:hypothetical protein